MALLAMPQPYDFEISTERFRAFGPDLANLWHEGGLHRVVGDREVRIEPAAGGVLVEPFDEEIEAEVGALLGKPGVDLGDLVAYGWFSEDPYPKTEKNYAYMKKHMECFPHMKVPYADVHGAVGIRYVNDRVVSFSVWRSDVSFC